MPNRESARSSTAFLKALWDQLNRAPQAPVNPRTGQEYPVLGGGFGDFAAPLRQFTESLGQATTPIVGQAADALLGMATPGGPVRNLAATGAREAQMMSPAAKMGQFARREAYTRAGDAGRVSATHMVAETPAAARVFAPNPREAGTLNELLASAKQYGLPSSARARYEAMVAGKIGPEKAKALNDADLLNHVDLYDLWPKTYLNEMTADKVDELVKSGWVTPDRAAKIKTERGSVHADDDWIKKMQGQGSAHKAGR